MKINIYCGKIYEAAVLFFTLSLRDCLSSKTSSLMLRFATLAFFIKIYPDILLRVPQTQGAFYLILHRRFKQC